MRPPLPTPLDTLGGTRAHSSSSMIAPIRVAGDGGGGKANEGNLVVVGPVDRTLSL